MSIHFPLTDWSVLKASGADATKFLNSFCTNDLTKLTEGDSCEAFFTDVKAHVLAYATICRQAADELLIVLSSPHAKDLLTHLDRYLICEKVTLETLAEHSMLFTNTPITASAETIVVPLKAYEENASLWINTSEAMEASLGSLSNADSKLIAREQFEQTRILKGIPKDHVDVNERNLPQEIDRIEQTISFTKGCYLGQEPVARIDALGQVNWLLRGLHFTSAEAPGAGTELYHDNKVVGRVTSSVATEEGSVGLGYIRRKVANDETELTFDKESARVKSLPF